MRMDLSNIFAQLTAAVTQRQHPWHEMVVATTDDNVPDARRVVLRGFDSAQRQAVFHTDWRAPKIATLQKNPRATFLWYDPDTKIQLRVPVLTRLHHQDAITAARWQTTRNLSKICYAVTDAPGTPLVAAPARDDTAVWDPANDEAAYENFAVVVGKFTALDILQLQFGAHARWRVAWTDNDWAVTPIQA